MKTFWREVAFLDEHAGPDPPHQLVLLDHATPVLDQGQERVEGPGRERNRLSLALEHPLRSVQPEGAEVVDRPQESGFESS